MQTVSIGESLHEMSDPLFSEKYHKFVVCWIIQESGNGFKNKKSNFLQVINQTLQMKNNPVAYVTCIASALLPIHAVWTKSILSVNKTYLLNSLYKWTL